MSDDDHDKRITNLETHYAESIIYRRMREESERYDRVRRDKLGDELKKDILEIKEFMAQQKTFIGYIILIVSAIFSVVVVFFDNIFVNG